MATSFIINIYLGTYYWIKKIDGLTIGAYTIIPIFVVLLSVGLICSMILISCNLNPAIAMFLMVALFTFTSIVYLIKQDSMDEITRKFNRGMYKINSTYIYLGLSMYLIILIFIVSIFFLIL